jgi:hypothetical protein
MTDAHDPYAFRAGNRAMIELMREHDIVRKHNLQFKDGDPQHMLLLNAEAGLVCTALEHFVRIVVGPLAPFDAPLYNLLQKAVAEKLLTVPWADQEDGIKKICKVRNTLQHGNFAQAAQEAGKASVEDYFKSVFASEIDGLFKVLCYLMDQINVDTGKPVSAAP